MARFMGAIYAFEDEAYFFVIPAWITLGGFVSTKTINIDLDAYIADIDYDFGLDLWSYFFLADWSIFDRPLRIIGSSVSD